MFPVSHTPIPCLFHDALTNKMSISLCACKESGIVVKKEIVIIFVSFVMICVSAIFDG
jgi:hypothetical protein